MRLSHGAFFVFLLSELLNVLFSEELDAVFDEDILGNIVVFNSENNASIVTGLGDEGIHVFKIDALVGEDLDDVRKSARTIGDLDSENLVDRDYAIIVLENVLGIVDIVDDEAENAEILGVSKRKCADIDRLRCEDLGDLCQCALLVFNENG